MTVLSPEVCCDKFKLDMPSTVQCGFIVESKIVNLNFIYCIVITLNFRIDVYTV